MKKRLKQLVIAIAIICSISISVSEKYIVYASQPSSGASEGAQSQAVTSDDDIVQKLLYYYMSAQGAFLRGAEKVTAWDGSLINAAKEKIASLFNGGGIYVDDNGNYVFANDSSKQIYDALMNNSAMDARVVSDFSDFTYLADGYINSEYLTLANNLTAWCRDSSPSSIGGNGTDSYILFTSRTQTDSAVATFLFGYRLPSNFAYMAIVPQNSQYNYIQFFSNTGKVIYADYHSVVCNYFKSNGTYSCSYIDSSGYNSKNLGMNGSVSTSFGLGNTDFIFNHFPAFAYPNTAYVNYYYCNNSLIFGKSSASANAVYMGADNKYISYTNIGTVNKTVVENNNWQNIYNNYITQVNNEYKEDPSMSASDLRKIAKKYTAEIVDAIQQGNENIEEVVSISNKYLQAISVDVRNIIEYLQNNPPSGGGSGEGGGMTEDQYNALMQALLVIQENTDPDNYNFKQYLETIISNTDNIDENHTQLIDYISRILDNQSDTNADISDILTELQLHRAPDYSQSIQDIKDKQDLANERLAYLISIDNVLEEIKAKIPSGGGGTTITSPPLIGDDLIDMLTDMAEGKVEELEGTLYVIGEVLQMCVPFCYLFVVGGILQTFAADPVKPEFEFHFGGGILDNTEDGEIVTTIDLSWVDEIRPFFIYLQELGFILMLIGFSFKIYRTLGSLFS